MKSTKTKDNMEPVNLGTFLRKYKVLCLIFLGVPAVLSVCCYFSVPYFNRAGSAAWLGFWGGYLGSAIMAGVTLYVLHKQLKQNHEENEENRNANEQANEKNRKLQIRVLEYQQQMQWLNLFREASARYTQIYNTNNLIAIVNVFLSNPQEAHNMVKQLLDNATIYDTQFAYLRKKDSKTDELMKKITPKFKQYNDVILDMQYILIFKRNNPASLFTHLVSKVSNMPISQNMKNKITSIATLPFNHPLEPFAQTLLVRISDIQNDMAEIQNWLYDYIQSEQAEIDKFLEE